MKEKDYYYKVDVKWGGVMPAKSAKEAREAIKQSYLDEYNLELDDDEIKLERK